MSDLLSVPLPARVEHRRATYFRIHSRGHLAEVLRDEWAFWTKEKRGWIVLCPFPLEDTQKKSLARHALRFGSWCDVQGPDDMGHRFEVHAKCEKASCMICDGGLLVCTVCNGAEACLPSECPRVRMTSDQSHGVLRGVTDFRGGAWVDLRRCFFCGGNRYLTDGEGRRHPCEACSYMERPTGSTVVPEVAEEKPMFRVALPITDAWLEREIHERFPDPDTTPDGGSYRVRVFDLVRAYQTRLVHGERVTPMSREELVLRAMLRSYQDTLLAAFIAMDDDAQDDASMTTYKVVAKLRPAVKTLVESVADAISSKRYVVAFPYQEDFEERMRGETAIDAPPKGLAWPPVGMDGGS